jgi:hypothetical protein
MEPYRRAVPKNPLTGGANEVMLDVKIEPLNDSVGGGAVSTAADYCASVK